MKGDKRREELMNATMDLVAENGLHNFSMKKVTEKVGCSEMLIYKYFTTKENLLYSCFEQVHKSIAGLFDTMAGALQINTPEELYMSVRVCWMMYFNFLVSQGNATLYYFAYRDSSYINDIHAHDEEARVSYFASFANFFYRVDEKANVYAQVPKDHLWTYVLDTTGLFAKRVIRGELPNTPESTEAIWKLISGGIMGLFR